MPTYLGMVFDDSNVQGRVALEIRIVDGRRHWIEATVAERGDKFGLAPQGGRMKQRHALGAKLGVGVKPKPKIQIRKEKSTCKTFQRACYVGSMHLWKHNCKRFRKNSFSLCGCVTTY